MFEYFTGVVIVMAVSSWLAWHTYEYLQYKPFGEFIGNFINWFVDYESKIWIEGVIIYTIGGTLMLAIPFVLVFFWAFIITFPFLLLT